MAERIYRFLSAPDLFNGDIGDARKSPLWEKGMPNSWNRHWDKNVKFVFSRLAAYQADDYFVAGDLVDGHWYRDKGNDRVFGRAGEASTIRRAGNLYYSEWTRFWEDAGVDMDHVHVAVGDHEIGDNAAPRGHIKYQLFEDFKQVFWQHFSFINGQYKYQLHPQGTEFDKTAFAIWLRPGVLLITLDCFYKAQDEIKVRIQGGQLKWLEDLLKTTTDQDFVMIQSHAPCLMPVRYHSSGRMNIEGNHNSAFWQLCRQYKVDLYLAGEVHADTAWQRGYGEPIQISHGGLGAYGPVKYMVGDLYDDGVMQLTTYRMDKDKSKSSPKDGKRLWSVDRDIPWKNVLFEPEATGTMTINPGRVITATSGNLDLYRGSPTDPPDEGGSVDVCRPNIGQFSEAPGEW